jgi:hypothetical protein
MKVIKENSYESLRNEIANQITDMDGYLELETIEMKKIQGFNKEEFRQFMYDGSGSYLEQEIQDLISQAQDMVIKKLFNL